MIINQQKESVKEYALSQFKSFYKNGRGLRSTPLKNYTSGDHNSTGLENLFYKIALRAIKEYGLEGVVELDSDYHGDTKSQEVDPDRMDFNFKIGGKTFLIVESRAWVDKPFYILKRAVVRGIMKKHEQGFDGWREEISPDVRFLFFALRADVLTRCVTSQDLVMGYGDRITMIDFSPERRSQNYNYFDKGLKEENVVSLVDYLCDALKCEKNNVRKENV